MQKEQNAFTDLFFYNDFGERAYDKETSRNRSIKLAS